MLGIGDFARYAGVSVRMLRHYDAIGLLVPAHVDPSSGYRRYEESQVEHAHTLVALKELGFSLEEVGRMLDRTVGTDELRQMLAARRAALRQHIEDDRARLDEVERRLRLVEGEPAMELEYTEKPLPELVLTQLTDEVGDLDDVGERIGPMFERLVGAMVEEGRRPAHPGYAWYSDAGGDGQAIRFGVGFETPPLPGAEAGRMPAEPRAVVATYRGAMTGIGEAWQELAAHVARQGLSLAGPAREVYLQTTGPQETWVTELQQPVA